MTNIRILAPLAAVALFVASPVHATSASSGSVSANSNSLGAGASGSVGVTGKSTTQSGSPASEMSGSNTTTGKLSGSDSSGSTYNSASPQAGASANGSVDADVSDQLQSLIDSNNGSLTRAKFMSETNNRYNADFFNRIDANRDGKLSALELQAYQNASTR